MGPPTVVAALIVAGLVLTVAVIVGLLVALVWAGVKLIGCIAAFLGSVLAGSAVAILLLVLIVAALALLYWFIFVVHRLPLFLVGLGNLTNLPAIPFRLSELPGTVRQAGPAGQADRAGEGRPVHRVHDRRPDHRRLHLPVRHRVGQLLHPAVARGARAVRDGVDDVRRRRAGRAAAAARLCRRAAPRGGGDPAVLAEHRPLRPRLQSHHPGERVAGARRAASGPRSAAPGPTRCRRCTRPAGCT